VHHTQRFSIFLFILALPRIAKGLETISLTWKTRSGGIRVLRAILASRKAVDDRQNSTRKSTETHAQAS
jgi:hypothetical protein